ncbi:F-box/kelch-repeat protein At3g06240 [Quercus suber]|uniref:F-box/kelch-repeat protein At3g06240 n=1 Tax=Quercus suber TaxID=58331 RepID=UPI000CE19FC9|nr:F-box/kelch-repeat protein At3g06240-like [Quercus suber]
MRFLPIFSIAYLSNPSLSVPDDDDDDFTEQQQHRRLDSLSTVQTLSSIAQKILRLPDPNVTFSTHGGFDASLGFGFDPKTNDYKLVRVVTLVDALHLRKDRPKVEVYSLSTDKWRMVKASLVPRCVIDGRAPQAFVNGALHWRVFTRADDFSFHHFVLVFDLGDEVFRKMQLPELPAYTRERMRLCSPISTYGNSIAFFHQDYNSHCLNIWVMKQYGIVSSWTKALSLTMTSQDGFLSRDYIRRAVGFTRSGKIVWEMGAGHLVSQDLETKETKDLGIIGYKYNFVGAYVESLILLDKAANGVVAY